MSQLKLASVPSIIIACCLWVHARANRNKRTTGSRSPPIIPPNAPDRLFLQQGEAPEPYSYLHGGSFVSQQQTVQPYANDPTVGYRWDVSSSSLNRSELQLFNLWCQGVDIRSGSSNIIGANTLCSQPGMIDATFTGPAEVWLDFGYENAAWIEIDVDSGMLPPGSEKGLITLGQSESNEPEVVGLVAKQGTPARYGSTLRLETNSMLYEGVRWAMINITGSPPDGETIRITGVRLVSQALPAEMEARLSSGDSVLDSIWASAVYTVRLNLMPTGFGAILVDRGDRIAWVGDDHVAQATALVSLRAGDPARVTRRTNGAGFRSSQGHAPVPASRGRDKGKGKDTDRVRDPIDAVDRFGFVRASLRATANDTNHGIQTYSVYWTLSLADYFRFSGDLAAARELAPVASQKLHAALAAAREQVSSLHFVGWDDRLGSGFAGPQAPEAQSVFRFLLVRATQELGGVLRAGGRGQDAAQLSALGRDLMKNMTMAADWVSALGLHSAAESINTGLLDEATAEGIFRQSSMSDLLQVCSLSNFNQYWIQQALGRAATASYALAALRRCWGVEGLLNGTTLWEISPPDWAESIPVGGPLPGGENGYTSACHPWAAGAAPWISQVLLGFAPDAAGFTNSTFAPAAAMVLGQPSVNGTIQTPAGAVSVQQSLTQVPVPFEGHEIRSSSSSPLSAPSAVSSTKWVGEFILGPLPIGSPDMCIQLGVFSEAFPLPALATGTSTFGAGSRDALQITTAEDTGRLSGTLDLTTVHVSLSGGTAVPVKIGIERSPRLRGVLLASGNCFMIRSGDVLRMTADVTTDPTPMPGPPSPSDYSYIAEFLGADNSTKGDWIGKYGDGGYSLFSFDAPGKDVSSWPDWAGPPRLAFQQANISATWSSGTDDPRALLPPPAPGLSGPESNGRRSGGTGNRSIGCLSTTKGTTPTFGLDVPASDPPGGAKYYKFSAYFVDFDRRNRQQEIAPLIVKQGPQLLNQAAPRVRLGDFTGGVWLSWRVPAGVGIRVRVSMTRGDNPVLSAVAVDADDTATELRAHE